MRIFLFRALLVVLLTALVPQSLFAQVNESAVTIPPTDPPIEDTFCEISPGVFLNTCDISESTTSVTFRFVGFEDAKYFCYKSEQEKCDGDDFKSIKNNANGVITEKVCGDGDNKIKGDSHKGCDDEDWFHQGEIYTLGLYSDKKKEADIIHGSFYIKHFYPEIRVEPPYDSPRGGIQVYLSGTRRGGDKENNYQIVLLGRTVGYEKKQCLVVTEKSGNWNSVNFSPDEEMEEGKYVVLIKEQTNEKRGCEGDFTYYSVPIEFTKDKNTGAIQLKKVFAHIKDPYHAENREQTKAGFVPTPICTDFDDNGLCVSVNTALGKIGVRPETFITSLFNIIFLVASLSAISIFVIAGYKIMTSGGNKERVGEAREQITAVILGILFIVLSIALLEFIGVDILRLEPFGFTR